MLASRTKLITRLLYDVHMGHADAREHLWNAVYQELHQLAQAHMAREANGRTLQPTALVHEAYLRLIEGDGAFENRRHFFAAAATAMRRILVDDARRRGRVKRGGNGQASGEPANANVDAACDHAAGECVDDGASTDGNGAVACQAVAADRPAPRRRVELEDCAATDGPDPSDILAVNDVMAALESEHPLLARVVELRFYGGLSVDQTAEVMEIAPRTVDKYWRAARAWLHGKLA